MRPLRLEVRAFGPFADSQSVDFTRLGESSLFLIHGATGAGKSSLLDAICFALYGESSGGERRAADIRSQFARADVLTEVTLVFRRGDDLFRVRRVPEQERPKLRGEGTTTQHHEACLERRDGDGWKPLAARPREVAEEIERILSFDVDQFRQVVVLPQGQFRELLAAGSGERGEILSKLFRTEEYGRVAAALCQEERTLATRIETLRTLNLTALRDEGFETLDQLCTEIGLLADEASRLETELETIAAEEAAATEARDRARDADAAFDELDRTASHHAELETRRPEMDRLRGDHARAERAARLDDLRRELSEQRQAVAHREGEVLRLTEAVAAAAAEVRATEQVLRDEMERKEERAAATREIHRLESLETQVAAAEDARRGLDGARDAARRAASRAETVRKRLERARRRREELHTRHATTAAAAAASDARGLDRDRRAARVEAATVRNDSRSLLERRRADLQREESRMIAAADAARRASERASRLRTSLLHGHAGLLATRLEIGEPCPVCGATEHPSPAPLPPDTPAMEEVEALEAEAERRVDEHEDARDRVEDLRREVDRQELILQQAVDRLGEHSSASLEELESALRDAQEQLEATDAAAGQLDRLGRELAESRTEVEQLETGLLQADADAERARQTESSAAAVVAERARGLPDELASAEALAAALADASAARSRLDAALEDARRRAEKTRAHLSGLQAGLDAASRELESARVTLCNREDTCLDRLHEAGFEDEEDLEAAHRDPEAVAEMAGRLEAFRDEVQAATARLERARRATEGRERPDLAAVESVLGAVRARAGGTREALARVRQRRKRLSSRLETLTERTTEAERLDGRHALVEDLCRVATDRSMPFERFVLAAMLDDVLARASDRLTAMSRGRFQLRRDRGHRDGRSAGGLDLVVFDGYTGDERPAGTLSGGEGFLASLALALGLADSVQAEAGGVHLDTMFVDEGFGSLDPEALELAYATLLSLPAEGRLVGVISHVPELRDLIPARVEVTPTARGSTVRVVT